MTTMNIKRALPGLGAICLLALLATAFNAGRASAQHGESEAAGATASTPAADSAGGNAYPLDFCPVTGAKLDSMGGPVLYNHEGREIRFCCEGCIATFEAEPAKYIAIVDEAIIAQQSESYPLDYCPVSGMEFGDEAIDAVVDNRLVRFCCAGCAKNFAKDPDFSEIDAAIIEQQSEDYALTTCPVSGAELGEGAIDHVVAGRLVRLCCGGCIASVDSDPAKYIAIVDGE